MGNCVANDRVLSREPDDDEDCCSPLKEEKKKRVYGASKREARRDREVTVDEEKKRKTEKKVRFKLGDDDGEGAGGEKRDLGNGKGAVRRVKVVVTKEELRQIIKYTEGSSLRDSSYSLEQLMMTLRSSRSGGRRVCSNGGGNYWRPGLNRFPESIV